MQCQVSNYNHSGHNDIGFHVGHDISLLPLPQGKKKCIHYMYKCFGTPLFLMKSKVNKNNLPYFLLDFGD